MAAPSSFPSVSQHQNQPNQQILLPNGTTMSSSSYVIASSAPVGTNTALQHPNQAIVCCPTSTVSGISLHPGHGALPQQFNNNSGVTYVFQPGAAAAPPTTQPQFFRLPDGRIAVATPTPQQISPSNSVRPPIFSQLPITPQQRTAIQPQHINANPIQPIQPATSGNTLIVQSPQQIVTSSAQNHPILSPMTPAHMPGGSAIHLPQGPAGTQQAHFIPPGIAFTRLPNGNLAAVSMSPAASSSLVTGAFPQAGPVLTTSTAPVSTVSSGPSTIPTTTTQTTRPVLARKNQAIAAKKDPKPAEVLKRLEVQIANLNKCSKLTEPQKHRLKQLTSARDQLLKASSASNNAQPSTLPTISPLQANASTTITTAPPAITSKPMVAPSTPVSNGLASQSSADSNVENIPINVHLPMLNNVRQEVMSTLRAYNLLPKCALNTTVDDTFVVEFRMSNQRYQLRMTRQQKTIMERLLSSLKPQRQAEILSLFHQEQIKIPAGTTVSTPIVSQTATPSQPNTPIRPTPFFIGQTSNRAPQMAFAASTMPGGQLRFLAAQPQNPTLPTNTSNSRPSVTNACVNSVRSNSPQLIRMPLPQALPSKSNSHVDIQNVMSGHLKI